MTMNIALLASGRGSNVAALLAAKAIGRLPGANFPLVLSNIEGAGVLEVARQAGVPAQVVAHAGMKRHEHEARVLEVLEQAGVDAVALCGYMRVLGPAFIARYRMRILNIHPSLLPAFPGMHAQRQAIAHGVKVTGCTVHFVDEGVDSGPIILQIPVAVLPGDDEDSLARRILHFEHRAYTTALDLFSRGLLSIENRTVHLPGNIPDLEDSLDIV